MSVVKIKNKKLLEKIQAMLTLKLGKRFSQQEILDKSIEYLSKNIDKFIEDNFKFIEISPERIEKIINSAVDIKYNTIKDEDTDIYGF
ncbi:MAG: hypothetical protein ACTSQO_01855 [Candidatus Helarchaeota archaeon]